MSKKNEKESTAGEVPLDYQIEIKNMQYTIVLREKEILDLKSQIIKNGAYIKKLESDIFDLRRQCANNFDLEKKIGKLRHSNDLLQQDIDKLNNDILEQKKKYLEEKNTMEKNYTAQIKQKQTTIDNFTKKLENTNKVIAENQELNKLIENLKKEMDEVRKKSDRDLVDLAIKNKLKFSILKKKMMENIKNSQIKVTELNMQYMDVSSKLTLLQNHQLLSQLEYLQDQLNDYTRTNEMLKKNNTDLKRDIEIHKEVELSLAEKNRKLKNELLKEREKDDKSNEDKNEGQKDKDEKDNKDENKNNEQTVKKKYNINQNMVNLEQKILNLEKKLKNKKNDFDYLKDKYDFIENYLRNYEKKFLGLINFLQDCLNKFFIDEELLLNREVNIHLEDLKKGDFSSLNREEQYSTLIILMKYLMPLVNQSNLNKEISKVNKVNLKFHLPEIKTYIPLELKNYKKINFKKPKLNIRSMSAENINLLKDTGLPILRDNSVKNRGTKIFNPINNSNKYQHKYKNSSQSINTGISTGN